MKQRVFEIETDVAPFRFLAESKILAIDHAWALNMDQDFPRVLSTPKQIGWAEDVAGLDLDAVECIY